MVMIISCFTTACQPTPDKAVIVNKSELEEKLYAASVPPMPYEAPSHWSETVNRKDVSIIVDTDIKLPDVDMYPVVKLEPAVFSQQRVDELVNYFAAGKRLYLPHVMTKADYELLIIDAKKGQYIDGEYVVTEESRAWVEELEAQHAAAPDNSPIIYTDSTLTYYRDYQTGEEFIEGGKHYLDVVVESGDGNDSCISVNNYVDSAYALPHKWDNSSNFNYYTFSGGWWVSETRYRRITDDGREEEETGYGGVGALLETMTLNKEEAESLARKMISDLGIVDLVLANTERAVVLLGHNQKMAAYEFEFARQSGGIAVWHEKFGYGYHRDQQPPAYSPPFSEEILTIVITEDGVVWFGWRGYARVVETVNENVSLLPFEEIQQALKNQIFYEESFNNSAVSGDYEIVVHSAELRMGYINVKDNLSQAFLVPVWVFETSSSYYNEFLGERRRGNDESYVFNAIDGGVIDGPRD